MNRPSSTRKPRPAISLIEVLISMGILSLGLLGVAAIFPVGGHYLATGDTYDRADAVAQAALADAAARGWLNPENWVVCQSAAAPVATRYRYSRKFIDEVRQVVATTPAGAAREIALAQRVGSAFVIDPYAVGEPRPLPGALSGLSGLRLSNYPAMTVTTDFTHGSWYTWENVPNLVGWPVRRLGLRSTQSMTPTGWPTTSMPVDLAQAESSSLDDISLRLPDDASRPSRQLVGVGAAGAMKRQWKGDFSWVITVAPGSRIERDALAMAPESFDYDVSAVVYQKREVGTRLRDGTNLFTVTDAAERAVLAKVVTRGVGGGQLLLQQLPDASEGAANPYQSLKTGKFVMLVGPTPTSTADSPAVFLGWYRVVSVENSAPGVITDSQRERLVTLHGPDWPWTTADISDNTLLTNDLRVGIFPGVVAVHTRTMKLGAGTAWE